MAKKKMRSMRPQAKSVLKIHILRREYSKSRKQQSSVNVGITKSIDLAHKPSRCYQWFDIPISQYKARSVGQIREYMVKQRPIRKWTQSGLNLGKVIFSIHGPIFRDRKESMD